MASDGYLAIPGFEGLYSVSRSGDIWSHRSQRHLRHDPRKNGRLWVELWRDGKRTWMGVHQAVARAFIPNPLKLPEPNHKDGNPKNNTVGNLEWVTRQENMLHKTRVLGKGIRTTHPGSKLSERDVGLIKFELAEGHTHASIAKRFGVCRATVTHINTGHQWAGEAANG